jgi:hypothetical protein
MRQYMAGYVRVAETEKEGVVTQRIAARGRPARVTETPRDGSEEEKALEE